MGLLTVPAAGPVYVDTNTLIYRVESIEPYRTVAQPLWDIEQTLTPEQRPDPRWITLRKEAEAIILQ
jgi:hypothetical protein